ncbi:MAG: efflux RND transporter periplasmic adaptor subunit, partial [Gammaproteobacteria bacterium]
KVDEATIRERQATLDAANVNLGYTRIASPVDGIVVSRSIDVGQTVAASFQTPTLFLIARDLTKMQVDTNVSESDIGAVRDLQKAFFTVESYPDLTFRGQVTQLRQAPITVQNVVTYDVVVSVDNADLKLLPGMTANTRIVTEERHDVLRVPQQALRFVSPDASAAPSRVWVLRSGKPAPVTVTTGLDDGTLVEVTGGDLKADDQVIVNVAKPGGTGRAPPPTTGFRF